MLENRFQIHKLAETETVNSFDCGDEDLNDFILNEASLYRKAKLAVTYVVIDVSKNEVVALPFIQRTLYRCCSILSEDGIRILERE